MKLCQLFAALSIATTLSYLQVTQAQTTRYEGVWTWLAGNRTALPDSLYGPKGVPSVNNNPGGRHEHSTAFDPIKNCIYVFGGNGYVQADWGISPFAIINSNCQCRLVE